MPSEGRAPWPQSPALVPPAGTLAPVPVSQQRAELPQYDFLVGSVIDVGTLERAGVEATRYGVATHEALLAMGLAPAAYASALARRLGVPLVGWEVALDLKTAEDAADLAVAGIPAMVVGRRCRVLCAESRAPAELGRQVAASTPRSRAIGGRSAWTSRCAASSASARSIAPAA
jgi:hypothetical protein